MFNKHASRHGGPPPTKTPEGKGQGQETSNRRRAPVLRPTASGRHALPVPVQPETSSGSSPVDHLCTEMPLTRSVPPTYARDVVLPQPATSAARVIVCSIDQHPSDPAAFDAGRLTTDPEQINFWTSRCY